MSNTIFLSYNWNDKEIAQKIDNDLRIMGFVLTIDERDLSYKANLKEFMNSLRLHDYTILIVSDSYLKSYNCLYEIGSLMKESNYKEKTLQVILPDAEIFKKTGKYNYLNFWDTEIKKLEQEIKNNISDENIEIITDDLKETKEIRKNLPKFIQFLNSERAITLSEIENSKYEYLLNYIEKSDDMSKSLLFSHKNNILLPLEDFRRHLGKNFKGIICGYYNYGFFVRIYLNSGYREGILHRKKFEPIYNFNRVKSLFTLNLEIEVKLIDLNFDCKAAKNRGGLVLDMGDVQKLVEERLHIELVNLIKNGKPKKLEISGLNLNEIPIRLYELKSLEQLDLSNNNITEENITSLFTKYLPDLKMVYYNDFIFINDEENETIAKIKYK